MTNEQQDPGHAPGCPPHEFGNALAWKWTREMPTSLKGGFLTTLYAMRAMASASGQLRFSGDGKPIRIQDIAKASGCREKDARRYLEAAIRAGVVAVIGERRRGVPTLYMLVNCPWPGWEAAAGYLKGTARPRKSDDESSGRSGPNSGDNGSGHSGPNSDGEVRAAVARTDEEEVRATAARMGSGHSGPNGSGHSGPNGSGHSGPNNPGSTQELPQEMADVVPQPQQRVGARDEDAFPRQQQEKPGTATQPGCDTPVVRHCQCGHGRILRADRDRCAACLWEEAARNAEEAAQEPFQGTFLLPLQGGGQGVSPARSERPPWPAEDPALAPRLCRCGREHRLRESDRCPACVVAAEEQRLALEAVRHA